METDGRTDTTDRATFTARGVGDERYVLSGEYSTAGQLPGRDEVGGEQHRVHAQQRAPAGDVQRDAVDSPTRLVPAATLQDGRCALRPLPRTRRLPAYR